MRIVVTGSSGRVGGLAVERLARAGHEVVPVDLRPGSPFGGLATRVVELTDYVAVADVLRGADAIVHLGNLSVLRDSPDGSADDVRNNLHSTYVVFEAAAQVGVRRIVSASSIQAYGVLRMPTPGGRLSVPPDYLPIDEEHPLRPTSPYQLTKAAGETIAESFARRYPDLTAWSLRFSGVSVPRPAPPPRPPSPTWTPAHSFSGGLFTTTPGWMAAEAMLRCAERDRPGHTAVNILAGQGYRDWSEELCVAIWGVMPPLRRALRPRDALFANDRMGAWLDLSDASAPPEAPASARA